jgi:hypothetical protein
MPDGFSPRIFGEDALKLENRAGAKGRAGNGPASPSSSPVVVVAPVAAVMATMMATAMVTPPEGRGAAY